MRIKSVRLKNYKRFTELAIADLPETARLVVLVGPNGTGNDRPPIVVPPTVLVQRPPEAWGEGH